MRRVAYVVVCRVAAFAVMVPLFVFISALAWKRRAEDRRNNRRYLKE